MNSVLNSLLTHKEILSLTGISISKRKLSEARRGFEPHLSEVLELLKDVDNNKLIEISKKSILLNAAQVLINKAEFVLSIPVFVTLIKKTKDGDQKVIRVNRDYLREHNEYVDLKLQYNRMFVCENPPSKPRNDKELQLLNTRVRRQNAETKNVPQVPKTLQLAK